MIKPKKENAMSAAINLVPQYVSLLKDLQKDRAIGFQPEILAIQNNVGRYVLNYDSELKIGCCLFIAAMGEDGFKEFCLDVEKLSPQEQQEFVDEFAVLDDHEIDEFLADFVIPQNSQEWAAAKEAFNDLSEEERNAALKSSAFFWSFFFCSFFNTLSLMIHGMKLTSLVPLALAGDDDAFLKAVQVDHMLLIHHPYFRERKTMAQNIGDVDFLSKLAYRESNSPLRGKIRYPALYMLFGILESFQWLHDLKHDEILDICDEAELDRYQSRIEDVNYITKRLIEYRRWQKTGGLSMH